MKIVTKKADNSVLLTQEISTKDVKKYFVQTYGCQANIRDSQAMAGTLEALGFIHTKRFQDADVLIINTCSVRQKSEDKVYGWGMKVGTSISGKEVFYDKKGDQVVFVTGCMIGSAKGDRTRVLLKDLEERLDWADYLLAPEEEYKIPGILVKEGLVDEWTVSALGVNIAGEVNPSLENETDWAYVNISTGCDNFCTFCVVPYARGEEKSRSEEDILHEIKHLNSRGFKNIMLVGQNVNSWGLDKQTKFKLRAGSEDKIPFADLLRKVHSIEEVEKINFISSNPFDFTQDLIDTLALPKITRFLHFAVQSGNNEILKKMNRRHTIEEFRSLIEKIKNKVPEMEFGTDIIVGFPSETEEQFMDTVKLFEDYKFRSAYISIYSPREGTNAQKLFKDDVPTKEKKRRHKMLYELWEKNNPL
jgi:tRNA-2-methylthio-N6-dimethylallyladenosine synthase